MTGNVVIGNETVTMCANAATAIRYKQVFNRDLLKLFNKDMDIDTIFELGFIMHEQAENADFNQITLDDYLEWLAGFEQMDLLNAAKEIVTLWTGTTKTESRSKKK